MSAAHLVRPVKTEEFDRVVLGSATPAVVDFWAAWCGPCRRLTPTFAALASELQGRINFLSVNVDAEPELAQRFGVLSIPTIKFFHGGREAATHIGGASIEELRGILHGWLRQVEPVGAGPR